MELNLFCCYPFWVFIVDCQDVQNLAHLVNDIRCLGMLFFACLEYLKFGWRRVCVIAHLILQSL